MTNLLNDAPFLRTSRSFPSDPKDLLQELSKSYVEIATAVNQRSIGLFAKNKSAINGESWYFTPNKQDSLQQVFTFTAAENIPHRLTWASVGLITDLFGSYTDGTNYYGVIFGTSVALAGQVTAYVTPTNIVVTLGAGAPAITSGTIVLKWLARA